MNYRAVVVPQVSEICQYILNSDLIMRMESGLAMLDQADRPELQQRYLDTFSHYHTVKSTI